MNLLHVVVECPVDELLENTDVIHKVHKASSVGPVILLLHGPPRDTGASGRRLALPRDVLSESAVIWVADPRGTVWDRETSQAKGSTVFDADPLGEGSYAALLDILRLPEVFKEVHARGAGRGPLSPALRVLVPGSPDGRLLRGAEIRALRELTAAGDAGPGREDQEALLAFSPITLSPNDFFTSAGGIGRARDEVQRARALANEALRRLERRPSRKQRLATKTAMAGCAQRLGMLEGLLRRLFTEMEALGGIRGSGVLRSAGVSQRYVDLLSMRGADGGPDDERIQTHVLSRLHDVRSVPVVIAELRATALKEKPRTAAGTLELLNEEEAETAEKVLATPPPFVWRAEPLSLFLLATFAASSACWPTVLLPVPCFLLILVAGWLGWLAADRAWPRLRRAVKSREASESTGLGWRIVALLAGAAGGVAATLSSGGPAELQLGSMPIAVLALTGYVWGTWRRSFDAWVDAWGVRAVIGADADGDTAAGVATVDERLLLVARDVIGTDWLRTESRQAFAEKITRVADALEGLRAKLVIEEAWLEQQQEADLRSVPVVCNPAVCVDLQAEGISAIYRRPDSITNIVRDDYFEAFVRVVVDEWPVLTAGYGSDSVDVVADGFTEWLRKYSAALHGDGVFGCAEWLSNAFSALLPEAGHRRREDHLKEVWQALDLDELLDDEDDLVQLCSDADLGMLEQDKHYDVISFAPSVSTSNPKYKASSMLMAGILRLVPLRATAVGYVTYEVEADPLAA
ncbi:MAG: hypothetical protein ABW167_10360 [Baekduia sp.]